MAQGALAAKLVASKFNINMIRQLHFAFRTHVTVVQMTFISCFTFIYALTLKHNFMDWKMSFGNPATQMTPPYCWRYVDWAPAPGENYTACGGVPGLS